MRLKSIITCPECGESREEVMPVDRCLLSYKCTSCGEVLKPKYGDCCVFCSYGTYPCPPMQEEIVNRMTISVETKAIQES